MKKEYDHKSLKKRPGKRSGVPAGQQRIGTCVEYAVAVDIVVHFFLPGSAALLALESGSDIQRIGAVALIGELCSVVHGASVLDVL